MTSTRHEKIKKDLIKDRGQGTYQILLVILVLVAIVAIIIWITHNN